MVLLKNENVIPAKASELEYIVLVGEKIININNLAKHELFLNYDNIGMQSGGWTGRWQGFEGNPLWQGDNKKNSNASSILDGLKNMNQKFNLIHPQYTTFTDTTKIALEREKYLESLKTLRKNMNSKNTLILSVVGESPYAEMVGDINIPYCQNHSMYQGDGCIWWPSTYSPSTQGNSLQVSFSDFDKSVIQSIKEESEEIPLVTVLLSGRPMIINDILAESAGFISAFLPGTSGGQGIVDGIFGDYVFRPNGAKDGANSLSIDWPRNMDQLKEFPYYGADGKIPEYDNPLFRVGYGLSTAK